MTLLVRTSIWTKEHFVTYPTKVYDHILTGDDGVKESFVGFDPCSYADTIAVQSSLEIQIISSKSDTFFVPADGFYSLDPRIDQWVHVFMSTDRQNWHKMQFQPKSVVRESS